MAYSNSVRTGPRLRLLSAIVATSFAIRTLALWPLLFAISPSRIRTLRMTAVFQPSLATKNLRSISRLMSAEFGIEKRDPRHVAARVRQIAHRAGRDGVSEGGKDNRDRRGCFLDGTDRQRRGGDDHVWPEHHEFGREPWNGLGSAGSGAIDVGDAPALDIAEIIHASAEGLEMLRQPGIKNSNLRKRGPLLRARRERPRG